MSFNLQTVAFADVIAIGGTEKGLKCRPIATSAGVLGAKSADRACIRGENHR